MTDDRTALDQPREGISRRTVVRAGANAAWAVPVVTVMAAAPAGATTTGGGDSKVVPDLAPSYARTADTQLPLSLTVRNPGSTQSGSPVTVTLTISTTKTNGVYGSPPNWPAVSSGGWTATAKVGSYTQTLTYANRLARNGGASTQVAMTVTLKGTVSTSSVQNTGTLAASASAPNSEDGTDSANLT